MGQSAGAHSAMFMLTMPDVRRLFRRVILQSAPAGIAPFSSALAAGWTRRYLDVLELPASRAAQWLRSAEPGALLRAGSILARDAQLGQVEPPFLPVVDELADPAVFLEAAGRGAAEGGVQIIVGTNRDEARAIVAGDQRAEGASGAEVDGYLGAAALESSRVRFYRQRLAAGRPVDVLAEAMTEVAFVRPSLQFAGHAARAGASVWAYQLDWAPAGSPFGACHCLELPLVFGNDRAWSGAPMLAGSSGEDPGRRRVARQMRAAWLSFARHGHPGADMPWLDRIVTPPTERKEQ